jgi:hypothetical protein
MNVQQTHDESYDDGLVHCHSWSRSTPPGGSPQQDTARLPAALPSKTGYYEGSAYARH